MMKRFPTIVLVLAGCASAGTASSTDAAPAPGFGPGSGGTCATGIVGVEAPGIAARTILRGRDGRATLLEGPLAQRVRLLTGAMVTACGQAAEGGSPIAVGAFALRQVDGLEAHLGSLRRGPGTAELDPVGGGVPLPLSGSLDALPAEPAVIWVAGRWARDRFEVLSFGVLTRW